jgi:hypothetical protein
MITYLNIYSAIEDLQLRAKAQPGLTGPRVSKIPFLQKFWFHTQDFLFCII